MFPKQPQVYAFHTRGWALSIPLYKGGNQGSLWGTDWPSQDGGEGPLSQSHHGRRTLKPQPRPPHTHPTPAPRCRHDVPTSRLCHASLGTGHSSARLASLELQLGTTTRHPVPSPGTRRGRGPCTPPSHRPPAPNLFVPDLQGFAANAVEDGEEAALECVFEHLARGLPSRAGADLDTGTKRRRESRADPGPKMRSCALDRLICSHPQLNLDARRYVLKLQLPQEKKPPQFGNHSNCRPRRSPRLKWRRWAVRRVTWIPPPAWPALWARGAQSCHKYHGLPVPSALKPRPSSSSLWKELCSQGTIFPS